MPLNPGNLTITFNPPDRFQVDRLHTQPESEGFSSFSQSGCTKHAASVKDKIDNTTYSEATNKIYTPYNSNTALIDAEWTADYGGDTYRVLGVHHTPDPWGRILHIKLLCKKQDG
ncbi:hypothetical protein MINTMi27_15260 [Mycobacterium intracellulare]|uniref:hypothetical protein n=1 Tax=Mycobacterium intracellulare TaxID=1767 RepID=UPI001926738B|nr:hypothetical protein [Mycobacterium intracellulare]BCP41433.1 hypothetical protein MINTMi27_15260 [Mycobacterium intracellulare]